MFPFQARLVVLADHSKLICEQLCAYGSSPFSNRCVGRLFGQLSKVSGDALLANYGLRVTSPHVYVLHFEWGCVVGFDSFSTILDAGGRGQEAAQGHLLARFKVLKHFL